MPKPGEPHTVEWVDDDEDDQRDLIFNGPFGGRWDVEDVIVDDAGKYLVEAGSREFAKYRRFRYIGTVQPPMTSSQQSHSRSTETDCLGRFVETREGSYEFAPHEPADDVQDANVLRQFNQAVQLQNLNTFSARTEQAARVHRRMSVKTSAERAERDRMIRSC